MTPKIRSLKDLLLVLLPFGIIVWILHNDGFKRKIFRTMDTADLLKFQRCRIIRLNNGYFFGVSLEIYEDNERARLNAVIRDATYKLKQMEEQKK